MSNYSVFAKFASEYNVDRASSMALRMGYDEREVEGWHKRYVQENSFVAGPVETGKVGSPEGAARAFYDELRSHGKRADLVPGPQMHGVNVWTKPTNRVPTDTVWFHADGKVIWGPHYEFSSDWLHQNASGLHKQVFSSLAGA